MSCATVTDQRLNKPSKVLTLNAAWRSSMWNVWVSAADLSTCSLGGAEVRASFLNYLCAARQTVAYFHAAAEGTLDLCVWVAVKGLQCCLALCCEQTADGVVPGSGLSMNAKIIAHKEVLQAVAMLLLRVEPHSIIFTRYKKSIPYKFENRFTLCIHLWHSRGF